MVNRRTVLTTTIVLMAALSCLAQDAGGALQGSNTAAAGSGENSGDNTATTPVADNRPPSGVQPVGLGIGGRKEVNISLNASQSWDSNPPVGVTSGNSWEPASSFGGTLELNLDATKSKTFLDYNGSGIAYPNANPVLKTYQNFGFSQIVRLSRWTLTAADTLNYSPDSTFGGYDYTLTAANSNSDPSSVVNPAYVPNQSILTPFTVSYLNTVVGQLEYGLTRRSSWTASGSYGILRYPDSDLSNTNQIGASTGYNHSITAKDAIFASYNYNEFRYTAFDVSFASQNVQFGYSRKVTGRFSFQVSGGPEYINATTIGAPDKQVQFAGSASLAYARGNTSLGLNYFAGTTSGSGVLNGAQTQNILFTIGQSFSRVWTTSVSTGYANNRGLVDTQQSYNSLFVSPAVRRSITRNLGATFNYSYQRQLTGSNCAGAVCGTFARSFLSVGVDYRFRPIRLE